MYLQVSFGECYQGDTLKAEPLRKESVCFIKQICYGFCNKYINTN